MNTAGQIASLLCPPLVAYSVVWFGSWSFPLYVMGGLFLLGAGCWLVIEHAAAARLSRRLRVASLGAHGLPRREAATPSTPGMKVSVR